MISSGINNMAFVWFQCQQDDCQNWQKLERQREVASHQSSFNKSITQWLSDWQHKATIGLGSDENINDWKERQLKSMCIQKSHLATVLFGLFQVVWFPSKVLWAPTSLFGKRIWPIMWWQLDKRSLEYRVWISKDCGNLPTWLEVPSLNK